MKNRFIIITIFLSLALQLYSNNANDIFNIVPDARSKGMGSSQVALDSGPYASFWNPAASFKTQTMGLSFADLPGDIHYNYFGYTHPFSFGNLGFSYTNISMDGFVETIYIPGSGGEATGDTFEFNNKIMTLTYANKFGEIKTGLTAKLILQDLYDKSARGWAFDAGCQYQVLENLTLGGLLRNLPMSNLKWEDATPYNLEPILKTGIAYRVLEDLTLSFDLDISKSRQSTTYLGFEYIFLDKIYFRAGHKIAQNDSAPSLGLGFKYNGLKLDISYTKSTEDYLDDITFFSLGYYFKKKNL